jgi:hypothetical protein
MDACCIPTPSSTSSWGTMKNCYLPNRQVASRRYLPQSCRFLSRYVLKCSRATSWGGKKHRHVILFHLQMPHTRFWVARCSNETLKSPSMHSSYNQGKNQRHSQKLQNHIYGNKLKYSLSYHFVIVFYYNLHNRLIT